MFVDYIEHAFISAICAIKNLSFAVKNKFLQVQSNSFSDTEILGILARR